ncbi:MAG: TolC family protein, partial [Gammaproteobacteria bacterium]|nr:TolC family protein [Gammaproteobacteria bacterium]
MWMRLAALAAIAFVPCVYAQGTTPAAPLTLDDAIARVAQYHPDLRLAQAQRPVWEARRDAAGLSPPLTVGVELENALGSGDTRGFDAAEVTVTLAGVLERGGKLDARRAVAQANLDSLAPQRETARLDLMAEVARRYLAVTDARQQLRIAETDIEQRRRAVAAARLRLQAGASPESVLLTAQAMLAQAELDRDRARQMDQSARASLSALWRQREPGFDVVTGDPMQLPALQDFAVLAEELQRTRTRAINGQRVAMRQPGPLAAAVLDRVAYGDAAYGIPGDGTVESLAGITRDQIVAYHTAFWRPDNATLIVTGAMGAEDGFAFAEQALGGWVRPAASLPVIADRAGPVRPPRVVVVDLPGAGQAAVTAAVRAPLRSSDDWYPLAVANAVMGSGQSGYLFQEVRAR